MNFDLITLKCGDRYFVYEGFFVPIKSGTGPVRNRGFFNDDLTHQTYADHDIIEVRRYTPVSGMESVSNLHRFINTLFKDEGMPGKYMKVIWRRNAAMEVTVDEIAAKFGVPVE